jgi:hypothetical protein
MIALLHSVPPAPSGGKPPCGPPSPAPSAGWLPSIVALIAVAVAFGAVLYFLAWEILAP